MCFFVYFVSFNYFVIFIILFFFDDYYFVFLNWVAGSFSFGGFFVQCHFPKASPKKLQTSKIRHQTVLFFKHQTSNKTKQKKKLKP